MENKSYSYGMKIVGVILHFFFTVILTMALFMLNSLVNKNILEISDIGTREFLESGYYTQCIQEKCDNLAEYMYLLSKGEDRTVEENRKYLQYTDEFKSEDTNFCFWYKVRDQWFTNQPDMVAGQQFDAELVLMEARTMGNYLLYDMENKVFGTDINKLSTYFFESSNTQMYWPSDDFVLIIGVDTQFGAEDDLLDASVEYRKMQPWIKTAITAALLSMIGWIITLVYLTLATGRRPEDEEIHLSSFDKIKTELLILGFVAITAELIYVIVRVNSLEWELTGILVTSGTVSLVIDALFLLFFLSIVKLMKAELLWKNSVTYFLIQGLRKTLKNKNVTVQAILAFLIHLGLCYVLALASFRYRVRGTFSLLLLVI